MFLKLFSNELYPRRGNCFSYDNILSYSITSLPQLKCNSRVIVSSNIVLYFAGDGDTEVFFMGRTTD